MVPGAAGRSTCWRQGSLGTFLSLGPLVLPYLSFPDIL